MAKVCFPEHVVAGSLDTNLYSLFSSAATQCNYESRNKKAPNLSESVRNAQKDKDPDVVTTSHA